ncbi:MAG: hypothetical protein AB7N71_08185 [Phycisphaerae bacterium]
MPDRKWIHRAIRFSLLAVFVGSAAWMVSPVQAGEEDEVELEVLAIRATTKNDKISPELAKLARSLRAQGFKFTGLELEERETKTTDMGKAKVIDLPHKYVVGIRPIKRDGKRIRLHVKIAQEVDGKPRKKHDTEVTMDCKAFQCWGGWEIEGGDTFIIAVRSK